MNSVDLAGGDASFAKVVSGLISDQYLQRCVLCPLVLSSHLWVLFFHSLTANLGWQQGTGV